MNIVVKNVPAELRYEARDSEHGEDGEDGKDGEALAGLVSYLLTHNDLIVFTHTETEPGYQGKGVASQLARAVLDDARERGLGVVPLCPFIKGWIEHHPDYADLVHHLPTGTAHD